MNNSANTNLFTVGKTGDIAASGSLTGTSLLTTGSHGLQVKNGLSTVASINQAGAIVGTSCQINGSNVLTATYNPFFCCDRVNGNASKVFSSGRVDFAVSRASGVGNYFPYLYFGISKQQLCDSSNSNR